MTLAVVKWLFFMEGVLFGALGVPLALGHVPPNDSYGFRTAKTLSDPRVWYEINQVIGVDLIIAGFLIGSAALLFDLVRTQSVAILALLNVAFQAVVLLLILLHGFVKLRGI